MMSSLLHILLLLVIALGTSSVSVFVLAQTYVTGCNNCISYSLISGLSLWRDVVPACNNLFHGGTRGIACSYRSATVKNQIAAAMTSSGLGSRFLSGMTDYFTSNMPSAVTSLGFPASTANNRWIYLNPQKELEYFWAGLQPTNGGAVPTASFVGVRSKFAFQAWPSNQPDDWTGMAVDGEHAGELQSSGFYNDMDQSTAGAVTAGCCMFFHQQSGVLRAGDGSPLYEIEVFSTHLTQATARKHCQRQTRYDANSGRWITGQLAVVRTARQNAHMLDVVKTRSDVGWHSTLAGFGVWMGGSRTHSTQLTAAWDASPGSNSSVVYDNGATKGACWSNFQTSLPWSAPQPSGLMMLVRGTTDDGMWWAQDSTEAMPYACSWEYSVTWALNATVATVAENLVNPAAAQSNDIVRYMVFGDELYYDDAQRFCRDIRLKNKIGDEVQGELAVVLSTVENDVLAALAVKAEINARGNSDNETAAVWLGASAPANSVSISWESQAATQFQRASEALNVADSSGCNTTFISGDLAVYCNFSNVDWNTSWLAKKRGVYLSLRKNNSVTWKIAAAETDAASKVKPFACSWHWPLRANVTDKLTVELQHRRSFSYFNAVAYCASRWIGVGNSAQGQLRAQKLGFGATQTFIDSHPSLQRPVWLGGQINSTHCIAYRVSSRSSVGVVAASQVVYLDCDTELPTVCYFPQPPTKSVSMTLTETSSISADDSASTSVSQSDTLSESASVSDKASASFSRTPIITESDSRSMSLSQTMALSDSITETATVSITRTVPPSRTPTASRSHNETHSDEMSVSIKTATFSRDHNTSTKMLTESAPITDTQPSLSLSNSDPPSTPTRRRTKSVELTNFTALDTNTREPTLTAEIKVVVSVRAPAVVALSTTATFFALASGAGVAVAVQARLNSASTLAKCGVGDSIADVPTLIESPLGLSIGDADSPLRYWRGRLLGNAIFALGAVALNFVVGALVGLALGSTHHPDGQLAGHWLKRGLARLRFPSLALVPFLLIMPSSATASAVLVFFPVTGRDVLAGFIGGTLFLFLPVAFLGDIARRISVYDQSVMVRITAADRKKQRKKWQKRNVPACIFDVVIYFAGFSAEWRDRTAVEKEKVIKDAIAQAEADLLEHQESDQQSEKFFGSTSKDSSKNNSNKNNNNNKSRSYHNNKSSGGVDVEITTEKTVERRRRYLQEERQKKHALRAARNVLRKYNATYPHESDRSPFSSFYAEIFDDTTISFYFLADFIAAIITGWAAGASVGPQTVHMCWILLIGSITVSAALFIFVCYSRCGISKVFNFYLVVASGVTLTAFLLALVKFIKGENFDMNAAGSHLSVISSVTGTLIALITLFETGDLIHAALESFCGYEKKRRKHGENTKKKKKQQKNSDHDGDDDEDDSLSDFNEEAELAALLAEQEEEDRKEAALAEAMKKEEEVRILHEQKKLRRQREQELTKVRLHYTEDEWGKLTQRQQVMILVRQLSVDPGHEGIGSLRCEPPPKIVPLKMGRTQEEIAADERITGLRPRVLRHVALRPGDFGFDGGAADTIDAMWNFDEQGNILRFVDPREEQQEESAEQLRQQKEQGEWVEKFARDMAAFEERRAKAGAKAAAAAAAGVDAFTADFGELLLLDSQNNNDDEETTTLLSGGDRDQQQNAASHATTFSMTGGSSSRIDGSIEKFLDRVDHVETKQLLSESEAKTELAIAEAVVLQAAAKKQQQQQPSATPESELETAVDMAQIHRFLGARFHTDEEHASAEPSSGAVSMPALSDNNSKNTLDQPVGDESHQQQQQQQRLLPRLQGQKQRPKWTINKPEEDVGRRHHASSTTSSPRASNPLKPDGNNNHNDHDDDDDDVVGPLARESRQQQQQQQGEEIEVEPENFEDLLFSNKLSESYLRHKRRQEQLKQAGSGDGDGGESAANNSGSPSSAGSPNLTTATRLAAYIMETSTRNSSQQARSLSASPQSASSNNNNTNNSNRNQQIVEMQRGMRSRSSASGNHDNCSNKTQQQQQQQQQRTSGNGAATQMMQPLFDSDFEDDAEWLTSRHAAAAAAGGVVAQPETDQSATQRGGRSLNRAVPSPTTSSEKGNSRSGSAMNQPSYSSSSVAASAVHQESPPRVSHRVFFSPLTGRAFTEGEL